jgi:hypothetical protein
MYECGYAWIFPFPSYKTAAAPASNANAIKQVESSAVGVGRQASTPLVAGNVVANCAVGFAPPLTVTVGLDAKCWLVELFEAVALTIEND